MVKENTMKQTEIGLLPEEWKVKTVEEGFDICNNLRLPISDDVRKTMQGDYPYYGPTKVQDYINEYRVDGEYSLIGEDGDHFLKWIDIPMTQYVLGKFNVNNHAHLIKGKPKTTITKWFYFYFKHRDLTNFLTRQGASRYKLSKSTLVKIPFAIPPLPEQEAIAEALSDADAWIESLEQLIAKKRLIKQGAMQELLSPKEDWEVKKLGEVCEIIKGKQFNSSLLNDVSPYPCYSGGISPSGYSEKYNELENTIIISEGGNSCGFVNFVTTRFWLGGHCYKVILKDKNAVQGFYYQLLKYNQSAIMDLRVGSGLPNIQKKALFDFDISLPTSLTEQTRIATILSDMDAELEALEAQLGKARKVKQGMMQELLTGRVRLV